VLAEEELEKLQVLGDLLEHIQQAVVAVVPVLLDHKTGIIFSHIMVVPVL
jgi:hypothetical protein